MNVPTPFSSKLVLVLFAATPLAVGCGNDGGGLGTFSNGPGSSGSGSGNLDCSVNAVQDYFGGTCASSFGDMITCWQPSGQCTAEIDLSGYDVVFESGAVLEHTYTSNGQGVDARYISPSGQECGTFRTQGDFVNEDWSIVFNTRSGEEFQMRPTGGTDDYEIVCANGDTVPLTSEQQDELQNCAGGDAIAVCTQPDIGGGDYDDLLDAIGRPCTSNDQCPSGAGVTLVCCDLFGEQVCYESMVCSLL